jgi:hypothetical protein
VPDRHAPTVRLAAGHRAAWVALSTLVALAGAPARAADLPPPSGLTDLLGPRALGLAAPTGALSGNDGVFTNPASVAARRRYSAETIFATDRRGAATSGQVLVGSIVDSLSSSVAASFVYARPLKGDQSGNYFLGGLAGPVADKLYLGAQVRYLAIKQATATGTDKVDLVTADAGLFWEVADGASVGFSGFNLIPTGHGSVMPRNIGAGFSIGSDTFAKLVADWRADLDRGPKTTNRYAVGTEVLLGRMVPVRAGFLRDETLGTNWWTAGVGLVTTGGVGLDLGYRQSTKTPDARVFAASLRMQFLEM